MKLNYSLLLFVALPFVVVGCQGEQVVMELEPLVGNQEEARQSVDEPQQPESEKADVVSNGDPLLAKFVSTDSEAENERLAATLLNECQKEFQATVDSLNKAVAATNDIAEKQKIFLEGNPVPVFVNRMNYLVSTFPKASASFDGAQKALGYSSEQNQDEWLGYLFENWSDRLDYDAILEQSLKQVPSPMIEKRLQRCIAVAPKGKAHARLLMGFKTYVNNIPEFRDTLAVNPHIQIKIPKFQLAYVNATRTDEQHDIAAKYLQTVIEDYSDFAYSNSSSMMETNTFGEAAKNELYELRNLQVGMMAPEIVGKDLDGTDFNLSDYRGKVVMLDFWGHWCGPCRRLYPRERKLVRELAGLPFALIGVNSDPKLEVAKGAVENSKLPWRNFWNGPEGPSGPIARQWNISAWPTIYLIDASGVIRYKGIRGANLDRGIEKLMAEAGQEVSLTVGEDLASN